MAQKIKPKNSDSEPINWSNIDTILLDMDGTLLDLNFDLHFWMEYIPLAFANKHNLTHDEAKDKLFPIFRAEEGKLHWYCLDYWQEKLQLDIAKLKEDVAHLIQIHPFVLEFLTQAKVHKKRIYLVTNAHRKTIQLKMQITNLASYFDDIISSHDYNVAKEKQEFWHKLENAIQFDKTKSIFFDDSLSVLKSAKQYGISTVVAISKPSSKVETKQIEGFINIETFENVFSINWIKKSDLADKEKVDNPLKPDIINVI
ncbi:HAD-IA family hydrolase [Bathymodiolus thermophilus thioautotrophic gill symbiont]|uniref:HAD family hydrolase n=1 Tax=Bathymodiolus thermophilus thioautotrophic gill symbiont TaxID=2360 RepID=A0A1J5TSL5_9GAMM|nr:HAD-IA family hydrolase [Bathymodiolus thermophilus thioautotrophic gill symbiont]OIR23890.1 HAD family hydrolase [Bathymodiolus thermophilus thioautotrophic gill symbiont]